MNTDLLTEKRLRQDKQVFRSNLHVFIFELVRVAQLKYLNNGLNLITIASNVLWIEQKEVSIHVSLQLTAAD